MWLNTSRFSRALLALVLVAQAAGLLALVGTTPTEAAFPGKNGTIVFTSNRTTGLGVDNPTGDFELFAMKPDGTGVNQLTTNTTHDSEPAWSADGHWVAYASRQGSDFEIFIRTDGYFDPVLGLFVFPVTQRLTTNQGSSSQPTWSPDGRQIAFMRIPESGAWTDQREIFVMDTIDTDNDGNANSQINLTTNAAADFDPAWSPNSNMFAFVSDRDGNAEIYVMADGTDPVRLTVNVAEDTEPTWSPNGRKIAFTRNLGGGNTDIYVMSAGGSEPKRLTKKVASDEHSAWSPDGKRIVFASNREGDYEIYVMKARPEGRKNRPRNLTKNDVFDVRPDWQPIP